MNPDNPGGDSVWQRLQNTRQSLLSLHKVLMEEQRDVYERANGRIDSSYQFLELLMNDPWFDWLHRLSELVVQIDEMLDAEEPQVEENAKTLLEQARVLLTPSENGSEFQRKYFASLQQSPNVVLAHAAVLKVIGTQPRNRII